MMKNTSSANFVHSAREWKYSSLFSSTGQSACHRTNDKNCEVGTKVCKGMSFGSASMQSASRLAVSSVSWSSTSTSSTVCFGTMLWVSLPFLVVTFFSAGFAFAFPFRSLVLYHFNWFVCHTSHGLWSWMNLVTCPTSQAPWPKTLWIQKMVKIDFFRNIYGSVY